jgi:hypothetical protein
MTRHTPISDDLWSAIVIRDLMAIWRFTGTDQPYITWRNARSKPPCIVELLLPAEAINCQGRTTLEHVHLEGSGMGLPRASDDWRHMVACCWYHNVHKPPSKVLRALMRTYLLALYPPIPD